MNKLPYLAEKMSLFQKHCQAQSVARAVLEQLCHEILPGDSERSIVSKAICLSEANGVTETWYHDCPALVLLGSRSCLSISGRDYEPSSEKVGDNNLVTIDLSPVWRGAWGDYARSFFIESGRCSFRPESSEFLEGYKLQAMLHSEMMAFVEPSTTFDALYQFGNNLITESEYLNLDFQKNLGHSIENALADRHFVEADNHHRLEDVNFFTFEPHIRHINGRWGFKHENIYYFDDDGKLEILLGRKF
ncbi:M24 family metallopeptidase [Kushneria aurantia]|uniref:M24 family metallopeptidase n=1 Tax=Kushneria aurantia TaxID=504092 RepID=A0ABV6G218_9GAMM|nr:M24 family metallopeptidase [Kushneria aurantia]